MAAKQYLIPGVGVVNDDANGNEWLIPSSGVFGETAGASITAALTGTATATIDEDAVKLGGDTVIFTLANDTFVTGTASEDGIAAGSNSDQTASGTNWNSLIKGDLDNTNVVISTTTVANDTATITLPAYATYDITALETQTWTLPAASLVLSTVDVVATPTFTIDFVAANVLVDVPTGSLGLTGLAPTVNVSDNITVGIPLGSLGLVGLTPAVQVGAGASVVIDIPTGSLGVVGSAPIVNIGILAKRFDQDSFRARNDDGSETTATWLAAVNTNWLQVRDQTFRARFLAQERTGAKGTAGFEWQCKLNSGDWESVHTDTAWDLGSVGLASVAALPTATGATNPNGVTFSSDGTKAYLACPSTDRIWQYPLTTAWDLSTAGSAEASKYIGTDEGTVTEVVFSSDGTNMYIVGEGSGSVYQYPLTTAWDLSTAGPSNASKLVSTEEAFPGGLAFSADGTSMYIVGVGSDTVYQYPLSVAWDLATAGITTLSKLISGEEASAGGLTFSSDGTKMYIGGPGSNTIYQYPLSTAWNVSTAGATNASKVVSGEENNTRSVTFSSDGTKMYIVGVGSDTIYQYPLTTAWDLSTAGATNANVLAFVGEDISPQGMAFSSDGTKVYIVGGGTDTVYQYPLTTAWDLSTAGATNASKLISGEDSSPNGVAFSSDGTKMYIIGSTNDTVYQYPLTTAWDLSTAGATNASKLISGEDVIPSGVSFSSDGTKMYIVGDATDTIYQYPLTTAWDLSTAGVTNASKLVSGEDTSVRGMAFSSDGTKMYIAGSGTGAGYQYPLTTAWDLSTAGATNASFSTLREFTFSSDIVFNDDGTKIYVLSANGAMASEHSLIPVVKPVNSTNITHAANTTQQIGSGVFVTPNAGITEDGVNAATASFSGYDETEFEAALQLNSARVSISDTVQLRLVALNGILLESYTNVPTITANSESQIVDIPLGSLTLTGLSPTVSTPVVASIPLGNVSLIGLAPTINATANITVDIPLGNVSLTGLAPTINTTADITVDIPLGSLLLTGLAPTINTTADITVDIPLGSLLLTGLAPTINATADITVDIPLGNVSLTGLAPTINATADITASIPLGSLLLTGLAPTINTTADITVDIPLGSLLLTGFAPVVPIGNAVIIDVPLGSLLLTGLVPTVNAIANVIIDVPLGNVSLTGLAPTINTTADVTVNIPLGNVSLTGLVPAVSVGDAIVIGVPLGSLLLTGLAPSIVATVNVVVGIPLAELSLTGFAPVVPQPVVVDVPAASLLLTGLAPTIKTGVLVTVPTASLALAGLVPVVQTDVVVDIPLGNLGVIGLTPTVIAGSTIQIPTGTLSLVGLAPAVTIGINVSVPVGALTLVGLVPVIATTAVIAIPLAALGLTGYSPSVAVAPVLPTSDISAEFIVLVGAEDTVAYVGAETRTVYVVIDDRTVSVPLVP